MYPKLKECIASIGTSQISDERKTVLQPLIHYIQEKHSQQEGIRLSFICTHNSRRSHLAQIWAQVMATHFKILQVQSYSGGTEATALYQTVVDTLQEQGLKFTSLAKSENPIYGIRFSEEEPPLVGFSKPYDHTFNPSTGFAAILTCSAADEGCPFIPGAEKRIPITYEDPKAFDQSPEKRAKYLERSIQIAQEMFYVFSQIN